MFTEQSWPLDAYCAAVQIMDKFLDVCCHILRSQLQVRASILLPLKPPPPSPLNVLLKAAKKPSNNPLQLVAVVCANLAGKTRRCPDFASWERKLRVYADHSVTAKEVQVRSPPPLLYSLSSSLSFEIIH